MKVYGAVGKCENDDNLIHDTFKEINLHRNFGYSESIGTNVFCQFQQFLFVCVCVWGLPLKASGGRYIEFHTEGIPLQVALAAV